MVVSATGRPDWIAADLIAQAEHDPDARAILLTPSRRLAARGRARDRSADAGRRTGARRRSPPTAGSSSTRTLDEAIALCQRMAPEHVVCDTDAVAARLTRAGTIFVGDYSAQASRRLRHRLEPRPADERRRARRAAASARPISCA